VLRGGGSLLFARRSLICFLSLFLSSFPSNTQEVSTIFLPPPSPGPSMSQLHWVVAVSSFSPPPGDTSRIPLHVGDVLAMMGDDVTQGWVREKERKRNFTEESNGEREREGEKERELATRSEVFLCLGERYHERGSEGMVSPCLRQTL
jgi:hypothetical protein